MAHLLLTRSSGSTVFVDASFAACFPFGWRHGDRFIDHHGDRGEIMGVGYGIGSEEHTKVLWVILDKNRCSAPNHTNGYATYYRAHAGEDGSRTSLRHDQEFDETSGMLDLLKGFGSKPRPSSK